MEEIDKKLELSYQRMSLVGGVIIVITGLPIFFLTLTQYFLPYMVLWFILIIIGILLSPKICKKIWKNF